ncbi:MAG: acyl-ACP--UDP-N-acetylglucosamine O-acyltransferase [Puniceicoccaceae bacterium]
MSDDSPRIHPTAVVDPRAELGAGVEVGAYAWIGGGVKIGTGCIVQHHATVSGKTRMGSDNLVYPYAFVGGRTHDMKFKGGEPGLVIGDRNTFREYVTVHEATGDGADTVLGNDNLILAYSHIAHDCRVGNHLIMSSHSALGGHVVVEDHVNIGWGSGVHQFCRLGEYAMLGAMSKQVHDLMPFMISEGNPASIRMVNRVGLERGGFGAEEIGEIQHIFRIVFRDGHNRTQALGKLEEAISRAAHPERWQRAISFIEGSKRGVA